LTESQHIDRTSFAAHGDTIVGPAQASAAHGTPDATPHPVTSASAAPEPNAQRPQRRRTLNVPLVVATLVVGAVTIPAAYFWHAAQVKQTTDTLLEQVAKAEQAGEWRTAADYLQRYQRLVPGQVDTQVRLARAFDKSAADVSRKQRAIGLYYETLGIAQNSVAPREAAELRGRLVELLLELQRYAPAELEAVKLRDETSVLLGAEPDSQTVADLHALAVRALALARYGLFRNGARVVQSATAQASGSVRVGAHQEAIGPTFVQALKLRPGDIELARHMAHICRHEPQIGLYAETATPRAADAKPASAISRPVPRAPQPLDQPARDVLADATMDRMVAENSTDPRAYLERHAYRAGIAQNDPAALTKAEADLARAIELGLDDVEVSLAAGQDAMQRAGRFGRDSDARRKCVQDAEQYFRRAIKSAPADSRAYKFLGQLLIFERQSDKAIEVLQQGLTNVNERDVELNLSLAEACVEQGQWDMAAGPLEIVREFRQRVGPQLQRASQLDLERGSDLLLGRWHAGRGELEKAIPFLTRVAALSEQIEPVEQARVLMATHLLGQCQARLGRWELAARTFEDAALLQADSVPAHLLAADAWMNCEQPAAAARHFERVLQLEPTGQVTNPAEVWLKLAAARLREQLLILPRENRNWSGVEEALAKSRTTSESPPLGEPWRAGLLEVEYLLARDTAQADHQATVERAKRVLTELETEHPSATPLWRSLSAFYQRLNDPAAADRALERFAALQPDGPDRYVLHSQLLAWRREFDTARKTLTDGIAALPGTESTPLQFALVAVSILEGNNARAATELAQLHEAQPKNTQILQQLADMAFEQGDLKAVERWETKLHEIDPSGVTPTGLLWRYNRARRLLARARNSQDADFLEAVKLGHEISSLRPGWPPAVLLSAMIHKRLGRSEEAIDAYRQAIRLGERRLVVYETLISLLYDAGRLPEAQEYLNQLREFVPDVESLTKLEVITAAARGQTQRAITSAQTAVERKPYDPMRRLVLGRLLAASGDYAASEEIFRSAIELAPTDVRMYSALFVLYQNTDRPNDARNVLAEIAARTDVPAKQRESFLALAFQQLGDRTEAEAHYRAARQLDPQNQQVLIRLATFLADTNAAEAESLLREAMSLDPAASGPRRALAALLAANGGEDQWAEAQQLLAGVGDDPSVSGDRRARAILLARRGGRENLAEARKILDALLADPQAAADSDRLLLARVYEAQAIELQSDARRLAVSGKLTEAESLREQAAAQYAAAQAQYVTLADQTNAPRADVHVRALVEFLLRRKDYREAERQKNYEEAERRVAQLRLRSSDELATAQLQARLLHATGRGAEVPAVLEPIAERQLAHLQERLQKSPEALARATTQLALTIGRVCLQAEQYAAAEPWLRRAVEHAPANYGLLAACVAAQGRVAEGLQLCLDAAKQDDSTTQPVLTFASLLVLPTATSEDRQFAEPILSSALDAHPDDPRILSAVADVRTVQDKMDDAIALYERVIELEPNNVPALNNLATILGERPDGREKALAYIERAIEQSGPAPGLLDTKGVILLQAGQLNEAKVCLEAATWNPQTDPRFFFHKAAACLRLGETEQARQAFEHAQSNQLERELLTPADQTLLAELHKSLSR